VGGFTFALDKQNLAISIKCCSDMTTKAIGVNGLVKNYGNLKAVDNVSAH